MEFIKININSTKPFYTNKLGKIFNQNYKELKCSQINGSHFLSFVLNDENKKPCKESVARLIYETYFPEECILRYNIFKKDKNIENPYQIENLYKVLKSEMPNENNLPEIQKDKINPIKRKFFEKLSCEKFNELILLAKNKQIKNSKIAELYNVGRNTIRTYRSILAKKKLIIAANYE
jgi:hypothetical protein